MIFNYFSFNVFLTVMKKKISAREEDKIRSNQYPIR